MPVYALVLGFITSEMEHRVMAENVTARTDKEHRKALETYVQHGGADNLSEAVQQTSRAELARRGYMNGTELDTPLRQTVREFARLFGYAGFAWFGFAILWSVEVRLGGVFLLIMGAILLGVDRALAKVEPRVTDRLTALVSREGAA